MTMSNLLAFVQDRQNRKIYETRQRLRKESMLSNLTDIIYEIKLTVNDAFFFSEAVSQYVDKSNKEDLK